MKLTEELKKDIDSRGYESLLDWWRFAPAGHPMFQGESGEYFAKRMAEVKNSISQEEAVRASKNIGWEK